jgi:beta-mannosidase
MSKKFLLSEDWKFKINDKTSSLEKLFLKKIKSNEWLEAEVPGTVLTDLLNQKLIPDPFYADNELKLQWISENDWVYYTNFDRPKDFKKNETVQLVFEGIDTIAKIIFNGNELGNTNNMFLKYEFDVSSFLKKRKNKLEVFFTSPIKYSKELENRNGRLSSDLNSERAYIRKAQYSFGWDWGPAFPVMGLWRPVYLLQRDKNFIENFTFDTLSIYDKTATIEVKIKLNQSLSSDQKIAVELKNETQAFEFEISEDTGGRFISKFEINNAKLWWPNGLGEQNLYNLSIKIIAGKKIIDEISKKIGIRIIKLILSDNEKPAFKFEINNFPVFLRGANWISGDCFLPRVTEGKYRMLLYLAKEANMNVIRVWGGGIYENDIFYETCDELGLLVWQDFMFACSPYPESDGFINDVKEEINYNVYRLQHHPSIAIWCGNNENEWIWFQLKNKSFKEMPGYKIFHDIIHAIVREIDPLRQYWQSSPFSNEDDPNSVLSGNRHQWDLWSRWIDYNKVVNDKSLFVTEFGFQAPANYFTLEETIPEKERNPQSYLFEFHNKQIEGNERLIKFLSSHLPLKTEWEDFIYLTQLNQALALKKCLEHWRFNQPHTNGSIIWQLNDTWPVTSWSLIDSNISPKLSYYFVKKTFQNQAVFLNSKNESLEVSIFNNDRKEFSGRIELHNIYLPKGKVEHITNKKFKIKEYQEKKIISLAIPGFIKTGEGIILSSFYNDDGELLQRNYYSEKEWKHLKLPEAKINVKVRNKKDSYAAEITSNKPAFFVYLQNPEIIFKDNGFIILPGENFFSEMETGKLKKNKSINVTCLNKFLI